MLHRATLKSFDAVTCKAALQLDGSLATYLRDVPVSRGLPAAELTAGRTVALLLFDGNDPADGMVVGVF